MQLRTIFNRLQKFKGFVYGKINWSQGEELALDVHIRPRRGSRPVCSVCGCKGSVYDTQEARRFEFVPILQIAVFFVYRMRRVDCRHCERVVTEQVPWSDGKSPITLTYRWFLAAWAQRLSWSETARIFKTSWQSVFQAVQFAVYWGIANDPRENVESIGIDEIAWQKGHSYLPLVYQLDAGKRRLLYVVRDRAKESLEGFFRQMGRERCERIKYVVSDMWHNYLDVVKSQLPNVIHVLDRFHVMKKLNEAIDEVRRSEVREMSEAGYEPILKKSRWCLLKRPENLTDQQTVSLQTLLKYNLKTTRAWLCREDFQRFWEYTSPTWAGRFLDEWITRTLRSRIDPLKKVAETVRRHQPLLLNWFKAHGELPGGAVEGLNGKAKLSMRKAYGYKSFEVAQIALFHTLGQLPTPEFTHKFW